MGKQKTIIAHALWGVLILSTPLVAQASASINYNLNQDGAGATQYFANTPNYNIYAEIGGVAGGQSVSPNFVFDHGAYWFPAASVTIGGGTTPVVSSYGTAQGVIQINPTTVIVVQIDEESVLVNWTSNVPGDARVIYGSIRPQSNTGIPNYGYQYSTSAQKDGTIYHSVIVHGLNPGTVYYFRPVLQTNGAEFIGPEVSMAPLFKTQVIKSTILCTNNQTNIVKKPLSRPVPKSTIQKTETSSVPDVSKLKIMNIEKKARGVEVQGEATPKSVLKIRIY